MTEPVPAKRRLARWGVIMGTLLFGAALAVLGFVFGMFDREVPVKAAFIGFTNSLDGRLNIAVVELKSVSPRVVYAIEISPSGGPRFEEGVLWVKARFRSNSPTGDVVWESGYWKTNQVGTLSATLAAPVDAELPALVELPTDGRTGSVEVFCWHVNPAWSSDSWKPSGPSGSPLSGSYLERWVVCDKEIQCPRLRQDGTVEPARIVR